MGDVHCIGDVLRKGGMMGFERMKDVFADIFIERHRQNRRWGEQNHPDGTGLAPQTDQMLVKQAQMSNDTSVAADCLTWRGILAEEVYEAFAESDETRLREELIQVAAVAAAWVEALDRRSALMVGSENHPTSEGSTHA